MKWGNRALHPPTYTHRFTDFICPGAAFNAFLQLIFSHHYIKSIKITIHKVTHGYAFVHVWKWLARMRFFLNSCAVESVNEGLAGRDSLCLIREGSVKNAIKLVMEWREHKKNKWRVRRRGSECQYSWGVTVEIWRLLFVCVCKA